MSGWTEPASWNGLVDGSTCPICLRGRPLHVIAELGASWLTMPAEAPMVGYVCLVSRIHAVELHDLNEAQSAAFMRDARRVSRAVAEATGALKLNYEIHGNTLPHLHMHVFPRHRGDLFEGRAIEPRLTPQPVYPTGHFPEVRDRLLAALGGKDDGT